MVDRLAPDLRIFADESGRLELLDLPEGSRLAAATGRPRFFLRFLPEYDNALLSHDDRTRIIP